jgi:sulfate transport system permease protein
MAVLSPSNLAPKNGGAAPSRPLPFLQIAYGAWGLRLLALGYIAAFVILPVVVVGVKGLEQGLNAFWGSLDNHIALSALRLSVWTAAAATLINTLMGTLTAYVLVKYRFPGKALFNTLIDLPFALPTLVTGVMLVLLYGPQTILGSLIEEQTGLRVLFAPPGIVLALLFVGYPFVIRTVQPVLAELEAHQEEAAQTLGASAWTTFWRIIFPVIRPAMLTGGLLSFARGLGEFGSIVIVSGNIPMQSQTATTYIYSQVEGGDMQAASAVSLVLLIIAFTLTLFVDWIRGRNHARNHA